MAFPLPEHQAQQGRQASLKKRRRLSAEQRLASEVAYRLVTELDDVAPAALQAALNGLRRGMEAMDVVEIESTLDVKRLIESAELAHRIYRLASGQSTANVAHASSEDRAARIAELKARLAQHDDDTTPGGDAAQ